MILLQVTTLSGAVPVMKERLKVAYSRRLQLMTVQYRALLRSGILLSTSMQSLVQRRFSMQVWQCFQAFLLHTRTAHGHSRLQSSARLFSRLTASLTLLSSLWVCISMTSTGHASDSFLARLSHRRTPVNLSQCLQ